MPKVELVLRFRPEEDPDEWRLACKAGNYLAFIEALQEEVKRKPITEAMLADLMEACNAGDFARS